MGEVEQTSRAARGGGVARITPYEVAFGMDDFEARVFPAVLREAEAQGCDPARLDRFGFLSHVGDTLRELVPPDSPPEGLEQYRTLLFHAFNFWRFGRRFYAMDAAVARYLVESAPGLEEWELALPHRSLYLQLPPNLFWASVGTDVPPEPVDGFFATECEGDDPLGPGYRRLEVLMVLGMRPDRAGYSVIPFETEAGPGIAGAWAEASTRDGARDFQSVLPGGEMAGLYSIVTAGEALKLVARAFWHVQAHPEDVAPHTGPERRSQERPGSGALSRLSYARIGFGAAEGGPADAPGVPAG